MKRIISLLLILSMLLCFALTGCDSSGENKENKEDDNRIALTLDNYEQYLNVTAKYYGENGRYFNGLYWYDDVVSYASVQSASTSLMFYDCVISVRIKGRHTNYRFSTKDTDHTITISLNIGGSGSGYAIDAPGGGGAKDFTGLGYQVVDVLGYVVIK